MPRISRAAVVLLIASLALTGCASASSTDSSESSAPEVTTAPASGTTITGTGYSFAVPEGWDIPEGEKPAGVDSLAADLTDTDGFADNVNVVLSPAGEVTPEQVETQGVSELEDAGAADVTVQDRVTVAGSESAHLSASLAASGTDYQIEQYYVSQDGQTYVVTFSFSPTVGDADRTDLSESVLAGWTWS
ncbi:hypothetical protein [Microbacterium sp. P01]|uniref:hypothetical protein n=1 Tax=unclassified Microbacterium TaxID=2609290 RepID=UPI00367324B0